MFFGWLEIRIFDILWTKIIKFWLVVRKTEFDLPKKEKTPLSCWIV